VASRPQSSPVRTRELAVVAGAVALLIAALPVPGHAQKLEIRNQSRILLGRSQITDTAKLTDKRYSFGFTNSFAPGGNLSNAFAANVQPLESTKLQFNAQRRGESTDWELKVNQTIGAFTLDAGAGSDGLLHTGLMFGKRKGKGFGASASWVGDDRSSGTSLRLWHTVETIDVTFQLRHDRRGFGWSADTGKNLANILRGVLRYETSTGDNGNGSSQQVIYGRNMRSGADSVSEFDHLRVRDDEDVFGNDGINIHSPLYETEEPLAWLVEGYGGRFAQVDLGEGKKKLEAEVVSYLTEHVWLGGDFAMEDGEIDTIDTRFGISSADLNLSATFGYSPHSERFSGAVQLRWVPFKPAPPKP